MPSFVEVLDEVGSRRGAGGAVPPGRGVITRTQITLEEIQEAYEEARAVDAEVAGADALPAPGQAGPDKETEEAGGDDADSGEEDAEA
ncbi:MAG: hypothetical protein ACYTKD_06540 [Planctomycetota bacterium]